MPGINKLKTITKLQREIFSVKAYYFKENESYWNDHVLALAETLVLILSGATDEQLLDLARNNGILGFICHQNSKK